MLIFKKCLMKSYWIILGFFFFLQKYYAQFLVIFTTTSEEQGMLRLRIYESHIFELRIKT